MKIVLRLAWLLFILLCIIAGVFYYNPVWVNEEYIRYELWHHGVHSNSIEVDGHRIHYFFNYSGNEVNANYGYGAGTNLMDGKAVAKGAALALPAWDLAIVEEGSGQ